MGATVCDAVAAAPGLELVAAVDPNAVGREVHGISIAGELRALADAQCIGDPHHSWSSSREQFDGGACDGSADQCHEVAT